MLSPTIAIVTSTSSRGFAAATFRAFTGEDTAAMMVMPFHGELFKEGLDQ